MNIPLGTDSAIDVMRNTCYTRYSVEKLLISPCFRNQILVLHNV